MATDDSMLGDFGSFGAAAASAAFPGIGTLISAGALVGGFLTKSVGTGQQIAATKQLADTSNTIAAAQTQISGQKNILTQSNIQAELGIEDQRRQAMELNAQRAQIENARTLNRTLSAGRAAAANSGALFSSGYQGGQAQAVAQTGFNAVGVQQGLDIGRTVFGLNAQISQNKIGLAQAQYQSDILGYQQKVAENQYKVASAGAQGLQSVGGNVMSIAGPLGKLLSGYGNPKYNG